MQLLEYPVIVNNEILTMHVLPEDPANIFPYWPENCGLTHSIWKAHVRWNNCSATCQKIRFLPPFLKTILFENS